jgi:hypothetical protein
MWVNRVVSEMSAVGPLYPREKVAVLAELGHLPNQNG